jgi:signal transduction histidine kinase
MKKETTKNSKKSSLKNKVLLLTGLVLFCPIIIITTVTITIGYRSLHKSIFYQQREIVDRIADRVNTYVNSNSRLLESVIGMNLGTKNKIKLTSLFKDVMKVNSNVLEIILLNKKGQEITKIIRQENKYINSTNLIDRKNRDEFRMAKLHGKFLSPVYLSYQRVPYLIIARAKYGVVLMSKISLKSMWQMISDIKVGKKGYAFVVDDKGILVAHPESARVLAHTDFSNLPVVKDCLKRKHKSSDTWHIYRDESGTKVVSFYKVIPELKWAVITQIPHNEVCAPINKMITQAVIWSSGFGIVFLFLGYKFVNNLLNPLNKLRELAGSISKGKFDLRIDIKSNDEIEELANTFNHMAESLKQLEELRQDLISMIVHDMKSPLSGIMGSLDYLAKIPPGAKEYTGIISVAKNSANNLLNLITNLLDISRMEEGKLSLNLESEKIGQLLAPITDQFKLLSKSEDKEFHIEFEQDLPQVRVDRNIITRVIVNLLTNALHHTISGGKIWLKTKKIDEKLQLCIADDGVGIPEEYRERIFEKFVQVERKRARLRTGTGLGLTFCKMAIELHGGKIWVESKPEKGSAFMFTLPVS